MWKLLLSLTFTLVNICTELPHAFAIFLLLARFGFNLLLCRGLMHCCCADVRVCRVLFYDFLNIVLSKHIIVSDYTEATHSLDDFDYYRQLWVSKIHFVLWVQLLHDSFKRVKTGILLHLQEKNLTNLR